MKTLNKILLGCSYLVAAVGLYLIIKSYQFEGVESDKYFVLGVLMLGAASINIIAGRFSFWCIAGAIFSIAAAIIMITDDVSMGAIIVGLIVIGISYGGCMSKAKRIG